MPFVQSNLEHQHTGGDHHELRQFGLCESFYSQIRTHIIPQAHPRRGKEAPPWLSVHPYPGDGIHSSGRRLTCPFHSPTWSPP
jgi:hypothetical protein